MASRLTKGDWDIINSALALYEADEESWGVIFGYDEDADERRVDKHANAIEIVRAKVHERLGR